MDPVVGSRPRVWRPAVGLVLLVAPFAAGCASSTTFPSGAGASSRLLDAPAFAAAVAEPDRVTIDVRVPVEGSLDGTDLEIPFDRILTDAARLPADRGASLALYCRSGRTSALAATDLARLGYRDVVELRGGTDAWVQDGLPLCPPSASSSLAPPVADR